jgi:hypothetical protein
LSAYGEFFIEFPVEIFTGKIPRRNSLPMEKNE